MNQNRTISLCRASAVYAILTSSTFAQLTWDPLDSNWDLTTDNWDDGAGSFVVWDNTGGQEAIFPNTADITTLDIANGGVTVGNLSTAVSLTLQSVTDNMGVIAITPGGATWDLGGQEISFLNNQANDTPLSIATGDTLTITGAGEFDTGERPAGANWTAAGATLDIVDATILRGNAASVGQFGTVRLAADSTYIHERNTDQTYVNDWELGTGVVSFDNRFTRNVTFSGLISGEGTLQLINFGARTLSLNNVANSFSGGVIVDATNNITSLRINNGDGSLGAVPATVVPDHITLRNQARLLLEGIDLDSNRGITLDGGGTIINANSPNTYGGVITGTGDFQIGVDSANFANALLLTNDAHDYTGNTLISQGRLILGVDEALPDNTVLTIGGRNTSRFVLNGFTQTLTGLVAIANNTRQIVNEDPDISITSPTTPGTVILNIADDPDPAITEEFFFSSAFGVDETATQGNLNIVKDGAGNIALGNVRVAGTVDVNSGTLRIGDSDGISAVGDLTNNSTLVIDEATSANSITAGASSTSTFNWEVSDWAGVAGTGFTQLAVAGDITLDATSTLTIVVEEVALANFTESDNSFVVASVGGTITPSTATISVDASGFTSGTGTWSASLDGNDIVLDYTAGAATNAYEAFIANFPAITGGFTDDDDNDGVVNGLEFFFFGSDPTVANSSPGPLRVISSTGNGNLVIEHDRPVDTTGLTVIYEWSTTLDGDFTPSGVSNDGNTVTITSGTVTPAFAGHETVEITTSSTPPLETIFVRLSVSDQ